MHKETPVKSSFTHYFIAFLLGISGLLIILIFISLRSQADDTASTATISNIAPTVDTVTISSTAGGSGISSFNLTENATTTVFIRGTYTDNNGCSQVSSTGWLSVAFHNNFVGCSYGASVNDLNCYATNTGSDSNTTCTFSNCTGGTDVSGSYACTFDIRHFADATDGGTYANYNWKAQVEVQDAALTSNLLQSDLIEINTLTALNITANIDYGSVALGATSSVKTIAITNTGNNNSMNGMVYGTAMNCTVGTIGVGQQAYTTSSSASPSTTLSTASTSLGLSITKQQVSTTQVTSNTRWMLTMPSSGLSGTCTGTLTFLAT